MDNEQPDVSMFGESSGMADVKLLVEGRSIPVIKAVLSVSSPVFRAMFEGDFKEKGEREISLPGKNLNDVLMLLKCIYPDNMLTITESVAFAVLPLSEEYQMTPLKTRCENVLLQTLHHKFNDFYMKDFFFLYRFLTVSMKFNLQKLKQYCVCLAADFKQDERIGMQHKSNSMEKQIDELAISRLLISQLDAKALVKEMDEEYSCQTEEKVPCSEITIKYLICRSSRNADDKHDVIISHMRGIRLAYFFLNSRQVIKKQAILKIREDKASKDWCHDDEYALLPENIKRDVDGVLNDWL